MMVGGCGVWSGGDNLVKNSDNRSGVDWVWLSVNRFVGTMRHDGEPD